MALMMMSNSMRVSSPRRLKCDVRLLYESWDPNILSLKTEPVIEKYHQRALSNVMSGRDGQGYRVQYNTMRVR
jgi:hypothetical protein